MASSGSIQFDDSRFPLVVITFIGASDDAEFEAYLGKMEQLLRRGETNALVLDASRGSAVTASQRRRQADWMRTHQALIRKRSAGAAFVITSAVMRGMLTAILWMQPMPQPHVVVGSLEEAERWAREQLRQRAERPA